MCKKRLKNESWPETVPIFPSQVAAASGKPLWDVKWLVHCRSFPGRSRKELGYSDGFTESGSGSWPLKKQDHTKAHFLFCCTSSSSQSLFLVLTVFINFFDANQCKSRVPAHIYRSSTIPKLSLFNALLSNDVEFLLTIANIWNIFLNVTLQSMVYYEKYWIFLQS